MPAGDAVLLGFALIGVFNAALLTLAYTAAVLRRRELLFFWPLAVLAATASIIIGLIAGEHAGMFDGLRNLELALTALSGALLIDGVSRAVGRGPLRAGYPVTLLALALALFAIEPAGGSPLSLVLGLQWGFTALGLLIYWRAPGAPPTRPVARLVLAFFVFVHGAQIARIALPVLMRDAVPLALSIGFAALTTILLVSSAGLERRLRRLASPEGGRDVRAELRAFLAKGGFADPDLKLADAAAGLATTPDALSAALAWHGTSFQAELTEFRLEHAAGLLGDPAEARTSVEAIGLLSGFASRSGFYDAFGRRFGESPAAWRRARMSGRAERTSNPLNS
ncbi:helix-turn-helix domain-containing protein [Marinicauda algicola]|uniref:Helix-turn-helix domain-containing protein n=1 Tax=Marinicauda algicola TaxID=2029849 RepID=A0A4S2H4L0_9PROT|nr:helix-turn-helix domain-containing protein [Marinicauda algicola]TGY90473.1 helix-turn-helix domain-containing protein [Marinicauda algicola]